MPSYGFELDELPSQLLVILIQCKKSDLLQSGLCSPAYSVNDQQGRWLVITPQGPIDQDEILDLAPRISEYLSCKAILYGYQDETGMQQFALYQNGCSLIAYHFGCVQETDSLLAPPLDQHAFESVIRNDDFEYVYYSKFPHPDKTQIASGEALLNQLFCEQQATLSWDYVSHH